MILLEAKAHIDHPEDMVFLNGSSGAYSALEQLSSIANNTMPLTLKYDGYPAIIFGRGKSGKFTIVDKHMFNKRDGSGKEIYSPEQFIQYDRNRGTTRNSLYQFLYLVWDDLEKMTAGVSGYYWADVLFRGVQTSVNGEYIFKANPHGITYHVREKSALGKLMKGKIAGIAVHQFLSDYSPNTEYAESLNGTLGQLKNNGKVALFATNISVKLNIDNRLIGNCKKVIDKYKDSIDSLFANNVYAKSTFSSLFTVYINKKIVSGDMSNLIGDFGIYLDHRKMSMDMKKVYKDILADVGGLFIVWKCLSDLKMQIVGQLDKQMADSDIVGYLDNGVISHEGYVGGSVKLVNRMGFSKQNLSKM